MHRFIHQVNPDNCISIFLLLKYEKTCNFIPFEILTKTRQKNHLRRTWQIFLYPDLKRTLNAKTQFVKLLLWTHRQGEWEKYLNSLNHTENSIYILNKCLLKRKLASHPILGLNGVVFAAKKKTKIFENSRESQFTLRQPRPSPPWDICQYLKIDKHKNKQLNNFYYSRNYLKNSFNLTKKKVPSSDKITNITLNYLPKSKILSLTKIINSCFKYYHFSTE